jgi:hypothetical protein
MANSTSFILVHYRSLLESRQSRRDECQREEQFLPFLKVLRRFVSVINFPRDLVRKNKNES